MNFKLIVLLLVFSLSLLHAGDTPLLAINVLGQVKQPQAVRVEGPTSLNALVKSAGGIDRLWGGVIIITKKESEILTVSRRYEFKRRIKDEEADVVFGSITVTPGESVFFQEIYD
ncbi:MAG: hypothetical protein K0R17_818 [Rariglobus sp.]|jgi:hypothetical protein|nr:hypothetical protein [Rariglobus sp.]